MLCVGDDAARVVILSLTAKGLQAFEAAEEKMMEVRLLYRILNDSKQMPKNLYAQMAFDMVEVDKHLANWRRYIEQKTTRWICLTVIIFYETNKIIDVHSTFVTLCSMDGL